MEIGPRLNGIHSLAEGLKSFKKFHENSTDIFALKDTILRTHHGLETLFKDILYIQNPVFLVPDEKKIKDIIGEYEKTYKGVSDTIFDSNLKTITLIETIERLKKLNLIRELNENEYSAYLDTIKKLDSFRNSLQHFKITANPDVIAGIMGIAIPRSIDIIESISSIQNFAPYRERSILPILNKLFPEANKIIELLRIQYDQLIRDTIKFFKKKTFDDVLLNLIIDDHGIVGPPPYMPKIEFNGFLNFVADPMQIELKRRFSMFPNEPTESDEQYIIPLKYDMNFKAGNPTCIKKTTTDKGMYEGTYNIHGDIMFDKADKILKLINAEDKTVILKNIIIELDINLTYKCEGMINPVHYNCDNIIESGGKLKIILNMIPRSYEKEEGELLAIYEVELNKENSPFRFHAFRNPDGTLMDNHILRWNINTKGNLFFK